MIDPPKPKPEPPEAWLTQVEARVVGCLLEKQLATPEQYPLTLSSLVAACNQKSNRDPVLQLDTSLVEHTLGILRREKKLVVLVHEAGARVPKYRQELSETHGLNEVERGVLAELLLRGPQTAAELRARVPRMVPALADGAVEAALEALEEVRGTCFARRLPKAHGRREPRYAHQLCGEVREEAGEGPVIIEAPKSLELERVEALEREVQSLRGELQSLRADFEEFKKAFDA